MRNKWDREDYRGPTIEKAIERAGTGPRSEFARWREVPRTFTDGQPYCPYGVFHTIQIPLAIARDRSLTGPARFLFGRKIFYSNHEDSTYVGPERLASDLGISVGAARSADKQLLGKKYLKRVRAGTDEVQFIWREELRSCLRRDDGHLVEGAPYRPRGIFHCLHVPMSVAACLPITWTAKEVFGGLVRHCPHGRYWTDVDVQTLALELNVSARTVERGLQELVSEGLIRRTLGGDGQPARTEFIWREWLRPSLPLRGSAMSDENDSADSELTTEGSDPSYRPPPPGQKLDSDPTSTAGSKEEEIPEESTARKSSSREPHAAVPKSNRATAEPDSPSTRHNKRAAVEAALDDFIAKHGLTLVGRSQFEEIARLLQEADADENDLTLFLETYAKRWREPPGTWTHVINSLRTWLGEAEQRETFTARQWSKEQARRFTCPMPVSDALALVKSGQLSWIMEENGFFHTEIATGLLMTLEEQRIETISARDLLARNDRFLDKPPCTRCGGEGVAFVFSETLDRLHPWDWCDCKFSELRRKREPDTIDKQEPYPERLAALTIKHAREKPEERAQFLDRWRLRFSNRRSSE